MDAFARARRMMVDGQLRTNDVMNPYLLAAFEDVPRERFVPPEKAAIAYLDCDLEVLAAAESEPARYLLKPVVVGRLIETAAVKETDRVLDIGCATGYSTAILARIAKSVTALEEEPTLAAAATANLAVLKVANATVVTGPLADGAAGDARFDVILINGAVEDVPPAILAQLAGDGRLVCVMQRGPVGQGTLFTALSGGHASGRSVFGASAPFLPGFTKAPAFVF